MAIRRGPSPAVPVPPAIVIPPHGRYEPGIRGSVSLRTFGPALWRCFVTRYFGFRGRASLAEFWWFTLVVVCGEMVLAQLRSNVPFEVWVYLTLIPGIAVTVRRLHDVHRSGWNYLWIFTFVGAFVVLYWACLPSDSSPLNRWGPPDPI